MSILKIVTIPDNVLTTSCTPVVKVTPDILKLASDMVETMRKHKNCIGIAAPQVSKSVRLIVVDVSLYPKPHHNNGLLVIINPIITSRSGKHMGREGCLSVPEFTGSVIRSKKIVVEGMSPEGKKLKIQTGGFEGVVLQHEIDHLDGILFLNRVSSLKTDVFRRVDITVKKE